jgi:hypothetical protein
VPFLGSRELDQIPSVNVNGSGKISVEVKAPAGRKPLPTVKIFSRKPK